MNWASAGARLAALATALAAPVAVLAAILLPAPAQAQTAAARHVVIVGIPGLIWSGVSPSATPALWRLAQDGSVGSLVDYAQQPLACASDGWLTLNSAARAQGPRPCAARPAVVPVGAGARVPAMGQLITANRAYHEAPDWGLLGSLARCSTAVGPGAALALASASGAVASYLPSAAALSPSVLARCPLTVVDLSSSPSPERAGVTADRALTRLAGEVPAGTLLLVTAPGAAPEAFTAAPRPQLMTVVVHGPGYAAGGLLDSASTRRPGIVTLTDLTPTVAAWLGRPVPAGTVGARITRSGQPAGDQPPGRSLAATVTALTARNTAEQVWIATHGWFVVGYAGAAALSFGIPVLLLPGGTAERRRRARYWRLRCWRVAGVAAAAVPLGSYLANLFPWPTWAGPGWWLYGLTAGWTLVVAVAALAGPWRRGALGPLGAVCAATVALLAVDVTSGSRLQLDAPFGLSMLVSGRYYGIGNDALGIYCVSALVAAAWAARLLAARGREPASLAPVRPPAADPMRADRMCAGRMRAYRMPGRAPALGAAVVGLVAVVAAGWPGFGAKTGGLIALVPCLVVLVAWLARVPVGRRLAAVAAVSGLALFLVFAVVTYLLPAAGVSDMGAFAGDLLHGRAGDLLARKAASNVGSLTLSVIGWLVPVAALAAGVALWRPAALRLRTLAAGFAALPLLRVLAWLTWVVLVLGWLADDQGVLVPAVALPFAAPLTVALAASASVTPPQFLVCPPGKLS